jgi:hypothetical protein
MVCGFFTDATGRARKVNGQFVTTAEAAAAGLQKQGRAAQQTAGKLNGLRSAVVGLGSAFGGIAAVLGVIQAGRFVFAKTAEVESQSRSLAILAGSAEKAGQIIKELQDLGAVTPFTSTELIDSAKRLQAFGVEADKVVETTRRLADASGATGAELSGLVTAYGQVQAKGSAARRGAAAVPRARHCVAGRAAQDVWDDRLKSFKKLSAKVKSAPKP